MDETVIRAMQRWPNVPDVYGWLALDRRGNWSIKTAEGRFERVANPTMIEFIGRNYTRDGDGRWYFQNGPQRVFVSLHYTPWVYALDRTASGFATHTGARPGGLRGLFLDDYNALLLETELGIGVLLDRDLPAMLELLIPPDENNIESTLLVVADGEEAPVRLFDQTLSIAPVCAADVPARFRFVARPAPGPGQPDC